MVLFGSWTYLFKGKQLECSLTHETRSYVPIFCARGPMFYQQWARLSPCRRHISMANWSFTAPSHLPCQWWTMMWAATIFPRHWHAEITSVWNGTTFLGFPLNDIDSPQASDMSATFHHQSWSCKIEYVSYGSHAERNKIDPNIKNTKPLRILT